MYRALDETTKVEVALKVYAASYHGKDNEERIRREVELSWKLNHPNLVRVFDWGDSRGTFWLAMELCRLGTLNARLKPEGGVPPEEACAYAMQIASALSAVRAAKAIHRDVKPDNCFFTEDGTLKLGDFGLVKADYWKSLTETGVALGTPRYMSPEAIEDKKGQGVGPRSDLYSLGVTLFEMLTGKAPFEATSAFSVASKHLKESPPLGLLRQCGVPWWLRRIVARLLEKNPKDRYPSAESVIEALNKHAPGFSLARRIKLRMAAAASVVLVLALVGALSWRQLRAARVPNSLMPQGRSVTAIAKNGERLWTAQMPYQVREARDLDTRPGAENRFLVLCGGREENTDRKEGIPLVAILSPKGEVRASIDLLKTFNPYEKDLPSDLFQVRVRALEDIDGDGAPDALVECAHFMYAHILYFISGESAKCTGAFANSGGIGSIAISPSSGISRSYKPVGLFVVNNRFGHQCAVAYFSNWSVFSASPDVDIPNCEIMQFYRPTGLAEAELSDPLRAVRDGTFEISGTGARFDRRAALSTDPWFGDPAQSQEKVSIIRDLYMGMARARGLARKGDAKGAGALYKEILQVAFDEPLRLCVRADAARSLRLAGEAGLALSFLPDGPSSPSSNPGEILLQHADCLVLTGRYEEAKAAYRKARYDPSLGQWYGLLGFMQASILEGGSPEDVYRLILHEYPEYLGHPAARAWVLWPGLLSGRAEETLSRLAAMDFQGNRSSKDIDLALFPFQGPLWTSFAQLDMGKPPSHWPDAGGVERECDDVLLMEYRFLEAFRDLRRNGAKEASPKLRESYLELKAASAGEVDALVPFALCAYHYGFAAHEARDEKEAREALKDALKLYPRGGLALRAKTILAAR